MNDLFNQSGANAHTTGDNGLEGLELSHMPKTPEDIMAYWKKYGQTPPMDYTKPKAVIAIDPGTNGAICILEDVGATFTCKMPDTPKDVFDALREAKNKYEVVCYMEKVQGMPKMGGSPMFNFGKGYGHLEMALIALEIKTVTTRPQEWQKAFGIGTKGKSSTTEWKNKLKAKAQQLFPTVKVTLWNADALLIGEWARNLRLK